MQNEDSYLNSDNQVVRGGFLLTALLGLGLMFWMTPLITVAQEGGGNPTPQCETCSNCCPEPDPAVTPGISPTEFKCASVGEAPPIPTVTPPAYCPGEKNGNTVTYTVGVVKWIPDIPAEFDASYGSTWTSKAYVPVTSSDPDDCTPDNLDASGYYYIGQCTWHIINHTWTPEAGFEVEFPEDGMAKLNSLIHEVPGLGGVTLNSGGVSYSGKVRGCCKNDGTAVTLGQEEIKTELTLGAAIKDINIPIPGIPSGTKEFKFSVFGSTYSVLFQIGCFFSGDISIGAEAGKRIDRCGSENCTFWDVNSGETIGIGPQLQAVFCKKNGAQESCKGLTASGTAELSFTVGGGHNVDKCNDTYSFKGHLGGIDLKIKVWVNLGFHKAVHYDIPIMGPVDVP